MKIISLADGGPLPRDGAVHKVTDLKPALRDQNRVNVYIDEEYGFSLDIAQVLEFGIKIGKMISVEELEELKSASEFGKLYQRTLEWALTRPHSVQETRDYLKRAQARRRVDNKIRVANAKKSREEKEKYRLKTKKLPEISDENCNLVINRLAERGYLDDRKFAKFYLENRALKKGASLRKLELELRNKGIGAEDIAAAMAECPRDETEEIKKIIAKKAGRYDAEKLISYLIRQGFDYQLSQSLVREMDSRSWE